MMVFLLFFVFWLIFNYSSICYGDLVISPVKLEFIGKQNTGAITIKNMGNKTLHFQVRAMKWTQEDNQDVYHETQDLLFFPKIFSLEGGKERVIRVGTKIINPPRELSYRLFIENIPFLSEENATKQQSNLVFVMRFGIPVLIKPLHKYIKIEISRKEVSNSTLWLEVTNNGNSHFYIEKVLFIGLKEGKEIFKRELAGWYVLSGAKRTFIDKLDKCEDIDKLIIQVQGPDGTLNENLKIYKENCSN